MIITHATGAGRRIASLVLAFALGSGLAWGQTGDAAAPVTAAPVTAAPVAPAPSTAAPVAAAQSATETPPPPALPQTPSAQASGQAEEPNPIPAPAQAEPEIYFPELAAAPAGKGAETWYYEAKKLELGGQNSLAAAPELSAYIDFLYRLAYAFAPEAEAREAGRALVQRALKGGDMAAALTRASAWIDTFGPDWEMYGQAASAGLAAGDFKAVLAAVAAARKNLASTAKSRPNELAFYEYSARGGLGETAWVSQALSLVRTPILDSWGARILRLAAASQGVDPGQAELALMRADFLDKSYASASLHAYGAIAQLLAPGTARHLISEAARSFLNSGDLSGGASFLRAYFPAAFGGEAQAGQAPQASADRVAAAFGTGTAEERLWIAAYYLARVWQAQGETGAAAILFLSLTESAPSDGDSDGALWNWLDLTLKRIASASVDDLGSDPVLASIQAAPAAQGDLQGASGAGRRPLELGALVEASQRWKNPSSFDDLVEGYDRNLLKAKAWNDALALLTLLGPALSPAMRTRFLYLDGRLVELGLATTKPDDKGGDLDKAFARDNFGRIVSDPNAEEYYRTMSAWRLGLMPPYLIGLPDLSGMKAPGLNQAASQTPSPALAAIPLIDNYLAFDLDDLASTQALKYLGSGDKNLVAGLAFRLSSEGQHYPALRLARDAVNRGLGSQYPDLYGLIYPRAWPQVIADGAAIPGIPEALAYAIIRSESVFDPTSVSRSGAVGLTQLMPSTASETARGLKMKDYSLTDPADNVRIGMTFYSYMLNRFGGKPVRAMFAYNAGPGRMQTWARESGELPDDVLLETLSIAEPRQYAKNIIQAALAYGKLHYSIKAQDLLEYLVNATPLPAMPLPAPPEVPAVASPGVLPQAPPQATGTPAAAATPAPAAPPGQAPAEGGAQPPQGTGAAGSGDTF